MTYIYGLFDQEEGVIRYVGKTNHPEARLRQHTSNTALAKSCRKSEWIRLLMLAGRSPTLVILDCVPNDTWAAAESKWIKHFKNLGAKLFNL